MSIRNQQAANQIAEALAGGITHPGQPKQQALNLYFPGLDPRGRPQHMQEAIKAALQATAEAIIYKLEQDYTIIPTDEYNQLKDNQNPPRDEQKPKLIADSQSGLIQADQQ